MKLAIFDIDETLIDTTATARNIYKKQIQNSYTLRTFVSPFKKVVYYPKTAKEIKKYALNGYSIIFITGRPRITNPSTRRTIKKIFDENGIYADFKILNSRNKAHDFEHLYKQAAVYFEDGPHTFIELYRINPHGFLVKQPYNESLCEYYPCFEP